MKLKLCLHENYFGHNMESEANRKDNNRIMK